MNMVELSEMAKLFFLITEGKGLFAFWIYFLKELFMRRKESKYEIW